MNCKNFKSIFATMLILLMISTATANWGLDAGRATEVDEADLRFDLLELAKIKQKIDLASRMELVTERQKALLGASEDELDDTVLKRMVDSLEATIVNGSLKLAENPAASCAEAQIPLQEYFSINHMFSLIGFESKTFGPKFQEIRTAIFNRCREETLDECNMTGRYIQIFEWVFFEQRQTQLIDGENDSAAAATVQWALGALNECAIYELHYTSKSSVKENYTVESESDGRIKLFPVDHGSDQILNVTIEGRTIGGTSNPFLTNIKCIGNKDTKITCAPGGGAVTQPWGKLKVLNIPHPEYILNTSILTYTGGPLSKKEMVYGNDISIVFSPALFLVPSVIEDIGPPPIAPIMRIPIEAGGTAFSVAHKIHMNRLEPTELRTMTDKEISEENSLNEMRFLFTGKSGGAYPVLYSGEFNDSNAEGTNATDLTKFELIHKPNKKPFPPRAEFR